MKPLTLSSHAKVNWVLQVHAPREDGFHDLTTLFSEITLADELDFTPREELVCTVSGFFETVPLESNLIYRAWHLVRSMYPQAGGIHVSVRKRIPMGGGLGGGSSNAAATIKALDQLFQLQMPVAQAISIASALGSDVPFFIHGGCCIGRGRGEFLTPVRDVLPVPLILVMPDRAISTRDAFRQLDAIPRVADERKLNDAILALKTADTSLLAESVVNDFELVTASEPWFSDISVALKEAGCSRVFLCGSGSTVAGISPDHNQLENISTRLNQRGIYNYMSASSLWA